MIRRVLFAVDYYERARVRLTDQIGSILSLLHRSLEPIYVNLRSSTVSLIRVHSCAFAVRFLRFLCLRPRARQVFAAIPILPSNLQLT
jgi:hypothetical protein